MNLEIIGLIVAGVIVTLVAYFILAVGMAVYALRRENDYINLSNSIDKVNKQLEEEISESEKFLVLTKLAASLDYHNIKDFDLNSSSWSVRDSKANGHYEFVSNCIDSKGNTIEDKFIYKNIKTGVKYRIDAKTLCYLVAFKDHQDDMVIHIGYCGGYPSISL